MFHYGASSTRNGRKHMEDVYRIQQDLLQPGDGYFAVFDGHGGDLSSKWCAKNLHSILKDVYRRCKDELNDLDEILSITFDEADFRLLSDLKKSVDYVGSTASVCYVDSKKSLVYTANVGDSKVVMGSCGAATMLGESHNCNNKQEVERIRKGKGLVIMGRVAGCLSVTRAFGDGAFKPHVMALPSTTKLSPSSNDRIIIASDGLWDVITDMEAVEMIKGIDDGKVASELLMNTAIERKSADNIAVIVIRLTDSFFQKKDQD